jgi:hypothetical protein
VGGHSNLATCSYVPSDYEPPGTGTVTAAYRPANPPGSPTVVLAAFASAPKASLAAAPPQAGGGKWYVYQCSGPGWHDALYRPPIWIPDGQQPGAVNLPSPAELAQQAYSQLQLPAPVIRANPTATQLVNLPTWMWVDPSSWGNRTSTASVPGWVSVTATAVPTSVTWSTGDGSTVTCSGPGTPFTGGNPKASSPDCGHTYRVSSHGQPNGTFAVAATVHWTVTWAGAGQAGAFPDLTTTGTAAFTVAESQALNTG